MAGNALPILLIGGAAALMLAGKKKKKAGTLPGVGELKLAPTTPPPLPTSVKSSGSGYPGVTRERMQQIQTMLVANGYSVGSYGIDGKYGPATKNAVAQFQEDWGLTVDGKPGPKTQAALEEAEAQRIQSQQTLAKQQPQQAAQVVDECDPLNPSTWGSGNVCEFDGTRWVRRKAEQAKTEPKPSASEVILCSPDKLETWPSDIKKGGVCLYKNKITYLSQWLPNNMYVDLPSDISAPLAGGIFSRGTHTWGRGGVVKDVPETDKLIIVAFGSTSKDPYYYKGDSRPWWLTTPVNNFAQWISATKSIAINYPEITFVMRWWGREIISKEGGLWTTRKEYKLDKNITGNMLIDKLSAVIEDDF